MRKLFILACVVLCTASVASAQGKVSEFFKSYDWTPKYRGEVNIGFVAAGSKTSINSISSYKDSDGSNVSEQMALPSKYHSSFSRPLIETIHGAQFDKYLFVGAGTHETGFMARHETLHKELDKLGIKHDFYVGSNGAHDLVAWKHLLYYRFLPSLWKNLKK